MKKKTNKKAPVRTTGASNKKTNDNRRTGKNLPEKKTKFKSKTASSPAKPIKKSASKTSTAPIRNNRVKKGISVKREVGKISNRSSKKIVKVVSPIKFNKSELKRLRGLKKSDGTYYSASYYKKLLSSVKNKNQDEVDDVLIALRNKNPEVRYFIESKAPTLHFQTGNFIDRLEGKESTTRIAKKSGRKRAVKFDKGEFKKGSTVTIIDFKGDEKTYKTIKAANEKLADQNRVINNVIARMQREAKLPKGKSLGVYVTIPEKVTANSEREVTNVEYNFYNSQPQGIDKMKFEMYLEEEIEAEDRNTIKALKR